MITWSAGVRKRA